MPAQDVTTAVAEWTNRAPTYRLYHDYFNGNHRYPFASKKFLNKYRWVLEAARENLIPAAVYAFADRLAVESWGDKAASDEAALQGLNRLARLINVEMHLTGDAYSVTWYGADGTPKPTFHRADQIVPTVDPEDPDQLLRAAKIWLDTDTGHGRVNIYYPDRLERWVTRVTIAPIGETNTTGWPTDARMWGEYEDDTVNPVEPHSFGAVPVCWWKHRATSQFEHGRSLVEDIIPPQDELNKLIADAIVASERIALPLRYVMDVAPEMLQPKLNPETGQLEKPKLPFDSAVSDILALTAKGPAGEFPGPDADKIIALQSHAEQKIARILGLPRYYFSQAPGAVPSGESLRVEGTRMVAATVSTQLDSTPVWKGQGELIGVDLEPRWADPMPMDESERLTNAQTLASLGLATDDVVEYIGLPDAKGIVARAKNQRLTALNARADDFMMGIDRGQLSL